MNLSIVVPVRNEEGNVIPLHGEITRVLGGLKQEYELIVVDDGSTDGPFGCLSELALADSRLRVIRLRRNYGQTTALQAGIDVASGEVIVTMDGDRQNDPADIPHLLSRLAEGFDVVLGVRQSRQDGFLLRRLPSVLGNFLIRAVSRVPITDLGCALKAVRADFIFMAKCIATLQCFCTFRGRGGQRLPRTIGSDCLAGRSMVLIGRCESFWT